jgi:hypothetical protein
VNQSAFIFIWGSCFKVLNIINAAMVIQVASGEKEKREALKIKADKFAPADAVEEREMARTFLDHYHTREHPFAIEVEWEHVPGRGDLGKGDLVFSSRPNLHYGIEHEAANILIVELKNLNHDATGHSAQVHRNHARNKVKEQVAIGMRQWRNRHPKDQVRGMIVMNESNGANSSRLCNINTGELFEYIWMSGRMFIP